MPDNTFVIHVTFFTFLLLIFGDLIMFSWLIKYLMVKKPTIGSHPTSSPPPSPFPFRMSTGKFPIRAITGYPIAVPNDDNFVLSA